MDFERGRFYLGGVVDPKTLARTEQPVLYDSDRLTTHGVIVGMTGSGKTGLGIDLLEEAIASGIACLVIDPKGDMGNLLLNFPDFAPGDFLPWVDPGAAKQSGISVEELAQQVATEWKAGLESWGLGAERMRALQARERVTIYTPGSTAGVGLNILGWAGAPGSSFDEDAEIHRDEIEGHVSSLLILAGVDSDPVSGPAHILLATIMASAWRAGRDVDLAFLIAGVMKPPFRKLGVFELDAFISEKDRTALAMKLNAIAASPSFGSWLEGAPLDIQTLLFKEDGTPRAAVIHLAHLSETERQFVVTLLLSKLVTWMRAQSGTSALKTLVYMDEVVGFAPPVAEPPSKKPILTILKQGRAFGVGMVLATQNPVDLDYKAMSNAGTWMIGRLQTERDKLRILEGLQTASGAVDVAAFDSMISGLDKRQFVLHSSDSPQVFATRWAMSYLAGPLTRDQVKTLVGERDDSPAPTIDAQNPHPVDAAGADATPVPPPVADDVAVTFVDVAAGWRSKIAAPTDVLSAAAVATVHLLYDDTPADIHHQETFEAIIHPLTGVVDATSLHAVDHDPRDFLATASSTPNYAIPDAPIDSKTFWRGLAKSLTDHLVRERRVQVWKNPSLKTYSRIGESEADFRARCVSGAEDAADADIAKLKDTYASRIDRVHDQLAIADRRINDLEEDVSAERQDELVSGAGELLGAILGGSRRSSAISKAATRRSKTRKTETRLGSAIEARTDKAGELLDLEDDLEADVLEITAKWNDAATTVEEVEIALERTDVTVEPLALVWLGGPTWL